MAHATTLQPVPGCILCSGKGWTLGADRWPVECTQCRYATGDRKRRERNESARKARAAKRRPQAEG